MTTAHRVLYLGGARSGKSTAAETRLAERATTYVATSRVDAHDEEWVQRVRAHRERRPAHWTTVETLDLPTVLAEAAPGTTVLIDCLTLWLTHTLDDLGAWPTPDHEQHTAVSRATDAVTRALQTTDADVVLVSNEVGSGIVPPSPAGREFRDLLGILNLSVAGVCDEVNLVVAGCVVPVKSPSAESAGGTRLRGVPDGGTR